MKTKLALKIASTTIITATLTAMAARHHYYQEPAEDGKIVRVLESRLLEQKRQLLVHLPENYARDATRRYPVLYVLDGASHASHTADSARLLARIGVMPEIIIVGIPSPSDESRQRDYTPPYMHLEATAGSGVAGQADRFLKFLETELIPHIDQNYRTNSGRMLAGNSRGGLFVVYSLIERPGLFSARFAFSPALWRDDQRIVAELAKWLETDASHPTFLYLSLGDQENEKMSRAFRTTTALLKPSVASRFRWRADLTTGATHQSNAILSTPVGLHEYFAASPARAETVRALKTGP